MRSDRRRGFTLLELLVGLALAVTLLGAMAWFVSDLVDTRERLATASARDGTATAIFERIESDLAFAVTTDGAISGVRGDAESIEILTRGVSFSSGVPGLGDMQRQEYRFDARLGALFGRRAEITAGRIGDAEAHALLEGHLERIRVRYHDGQSWREDFDSRRDGGLPVLVEIALWWAPRSADAGNGDGVDEPDARLAEFSDFLDEPPDEPRTRQVDLDNLFRDEGRSPDRLRVIRVPDARALDPDAVGFDDAMAEVDG